jgi:ATP-dependent Lon protease
MHVYEIEPPDAEGARRIALAIYRDVRGTHDWGKRFPEAPSAAVVDRLAALSPREMRRAVLAAFGNAKIAGRAELSAEDVQDARGAKRRIGF